MGLGVFFVDTEVAFTATVFNTATAVAVTGNTNNSVKPNTLSGFEWDQTLWKIDN